MGGPIGRFRDRRRAQQRRICPLARFCTGPLCGSIEGAVAPRWGHFLGYVVPGYTMPSPRWLGRSVSDLAVI
eukprot:10648098-Lingulodinium_polyedra.AAC.1